MGRKKQQEFYSEVEQLYDRQTFIESIKEGFKEVQDPRASDNQSYPLAYLLVRKEGGHYFIALKGNQGKLQAEAENFFSQARDVDYKETGCQRISTCEKGHGRIEKRQIVVINDLDWLDCKRDWQDLTSLIEVTCRRTIDGKTTEAKRYFISDLDLRPEKAGELARSHWLIENHLHWNMDVNFGEDSTLASIGHAPENLAILKSIAGTLIRMDLGGIRGTAERRRQAMWDDPWTLRLLSRIFEVKL